MLTTRLSPFSAGDFPQEVDCLVPAIKVSTFGGRIVAKG